MAFSSANWSNQGQQFSSHIFRIRSFDGYTDRETTATITAAGFFNNVSDQVSVGDLIYVTLNSGSTAAPVKNTYVYRVKTNSDAGVVGLSAGAVVGGT